MQLEDAALEQQWETNPYVQISHDLAERGWSVTEQFLPPLMIAQLAGESQVLRAAGQFREAGIGRGKAFRIEPELRKDRVMWLDPSHCSDMQQGYLDSLEALRLAINRQLFLGLFEYEGHLAFYSTGSYYRKHLDRFKGTEQRVLSAILYLNQAWNERDGGQLRLYTDPTDESRFEEVLPFAGRLVVFLSARFPHEVMPARCDRLSITGWFKQREDSFPLE